MTLEQILKKNGITRKVNDNFVTYIKGEKKYDMTGFDIMKYERHFIDYEKMIEDIKVKLQ